MKKTRRYHRSFFFPKWSEEAINSYISNISSGSSLKFSLHAVQNIVEYSFEYGKVLFNFLLKAAKKDSLRFENVFEFYSVEERVKKACFRFSFDEFPVDIVLVISADGVVITMFTTNKVDIHATLDSNLYERS